MREPNRLDKFYNKLCKIHKEKFPDWRFGQLCCNFFGWLGHNKGRDPFFPEEDAMLKYLDEYCKAVLGEQTNVTEVQDFDKE